MTLSLLLLTLTFTLLTACKSASSNPTPNPTSNTPSTEATDSRTPPRYLESPALEQFPDTPLTSKQEKQVQELGKKQAQADIKRNHLALIQFGRPHPATPIYNKLLLEKYNIHSSHVISPTHANITYAAAYNDTMQNEFNKRFNPNILNATFQQAIKTYNAQHPK